MSVTPQDSYTLACFLDKQLQHFTALWSIFEKIYVPKQSKDK
jgi:hypothetical protein